MVRECNYIAFGHGAKMGILVRPRVVHTIN